MKNQSAKDSAKHQSAVHRAVKSKASSSPSDLSAEGVSLNTLYPQGVLVGAFVDLEEMIKLLNQYSEEIEYRLEPVPNQDNVFLFIEDPLAADEYECGVILKDEGQAIAFSEAVYQMVMRAYQHLTELSGQTWE